MIEYTSFYNSPKINHQFSRVLLAITIVILWSAQLFSQQIPDDRVIDVKNIQDYLKKDIVNQLEENGGISTNSLANYFRQKFASSFYYDYKTLNNRLKIYNQLYNNQNSHQSRAMDHMGKYPDSTQWILPFNYQNGEPVNAYALRHLARQHKMVDIALHYFNDNKNPKYIQYFENQLQSLNAALYANQYDKISDGNGVYEVFRAGYRIFNWLWIHNLFLNEKEYSDEDQLRTIATLLQHGQHLYERNDSFRSGNHQTKGMSALAVLAILMNDFEGVDKWYDRAMQRLSEHLDKEINQDGFQFERSVHYHMSDINNYFYVYQLAKINAIEVDKNWENKLRILFTTLVKIAYPDKSAPVLQDDTEIPWGEKNDISGAMTLGYLLFEDPEFGYFASEMVADRVYWYLSNEQVEKLKNIEKKVPSYGSLFFENTEYYIMREGWERDDKMMIISAGVDSIKPDHQHGDVLGIQAIANSQIILPNYQVRYSLKDFELFKNSLVKNVALVDDELQGKQWTSNKGGSGFGKFRALPQPTILAWDSNDQYDLFVGSHDGFHNVDVDYSRQVIYVKNDFWIVKDNFRSEAKHDYKQVWQGHYTTEHGANLLRSSFDNGAGCDIYQLYAIDTVITDGTRGKHWNIVTKKDQHDFDFITVIYPYRRYHKRIDETASEISLAEWKVNNISWNIKGNETVTFSIENQAFIFNALEIQTLDIQIVCEVEADVFVHSKKGNILISSLDDQPISITFSTNENKKDKKSILLSPGSSYVFKILE